MGNDAGFENLQAREGASAFHRLAHERKIPLNVQLQITDRCNLRCEFCYNSLVHKHDELSLAEIRDIIAQARAAGALYFCLTGGEPTLHPDFAEIAREIVNAGMAFELITNGTLLRKEHFALFEELQPRYVAVSLHGMGEHSHERLTRSVKSFERTVDSIHELRKRGVTVDLRIPITRYNADEADDLIAFAESLGITYRVDCNITYREDGDTSSIGPRMERKQLLDFYTRKWERWLKDHQPFEVNGRLFDALDESYICSAGNTYAYIDSRGILYPCASYQRPIGSLREHSLASLWQHSPFLKRLRALKTKDLTGCGGCEDKPFCSFCPGDARLEGIDHDNGFGLYKRACDSAAMNRQAYEEVCLDPAARRS